MSLTGDEFAAFVIGKMGTPYVYGAKGADGIFTQSKLNSLKAAYPDMFTAGYLAKIKQKELVGKVCTDCSGLISWYTGKELGSAQLYSNAYARLPMSKLNDFAVGTVLYKQGHVGVYVGKDNKGNNICVEARGIDYGTVAGAISDPNRWRCGLTFNYIQYSVPKKIKEITYKSSNPYAIPKTTVAKGDKNESEVKWLQFELREAGYDKTFTYNGARYKGIVIDGEFGNITLAAVLSFQKSCKLTVDGVVGPKTIAALVKNEG